MCIRQSCCFVVLLAFLVMGCQDTDQPAPAAQTASNEMPAAVERTPAQESRKEAALATLRANWDSDVITGATVDEIKKVLEDGSPENVEPLLQRIELLQQSGDVYAPDFALWWEERGREEVGGSLFWNRELVHEAVALLMEGARARDVFEMLQEAAETNDPVARMWVALLNPDNSGRHDGSVLGPLLSVIDEVRALIDAGDTDAAYFLGLLALQGDLDLVNANPEEALGWLETAADAGNDHAAALLAETYRTGMRGFPADPAKAKHWAARAAGTEAEASIIKQRTAANIASSANNLKQLGLIGKMVANESPGEKWPALSSTPGQLMMDPAVVYPEYLTDPRICISPAHPKFQTLLEMADSDPLSVMRDDSYWYLGYAITNDEQGFEFVNAIRMAVEAGETLTGDIETPALETERIFRIREGVHRFFITDINDPRASQRTQSTIPVIIERPGLHTDGANVLFFDGHVEFIEYPGEFPMTESFIQALQSLDDLKS